MLHRKVLFALVLFFSIVLLLLSSCAEEKLSPKEIPITTSSDEALQLFLQGRDIFDKLKTPQAAEYFDKAIAIDKDFAMAYLYRAFSGGGYKLFYENLGKAVDLLDKVSIGEKHLILFNKAESSADRKAELDSLLNLFSEDKRVQQLAGNYYYGLLDYSTALDHYKKLIEIDSNFAPCYNQLGYAYLGMENFAEAEKSFNKYIELIPGEANPYDSYAEFLLTQGRYDESIEQYNQAFQTDSEFVTALVGLGNNFVFKGDYNKARDYYQQYFDKSFNISQKLSALFWKAVTHIYEGKISDAVKFLDERSKLAFDNNSPAAGITGYRLSEWILAESGNFKEAEKYFNKTASAIKSSELKDADRKAFEIYADLDRAYTQILKKDIKGAEKSLTAIKQVVENRQEPAETEYLNLINGILQFKKGKNDLALQYFDNAEKENPFVWYWKAVVQEKAGNKEEAKKLYTKIAGNNLNSISLALVRGRAKNKL